MMAKRYRGGAPSEPPDPTPRYRGGAPSEPPDRPPTIPKPPDAAKPIGVRPTPPIKVDTLEKIFEKGPPSNQAELEQQYKAEQERPKWQQVLFGPTVVKGDGKYYQLYTTEPPLAPIGSTGRVFKLVSFTKNEWRKIRYYKDIFDLRRSRPTPEQTRNLQDLKLSLSISKWRQEYWQRSIAQLKVEPKILIQGIPVKLSEFLMSLKPGQKVEFSAEPLPDPQPGVITIKVPKTVLPLMDPSIKPAIKPAPTHKPLPEGEPYYPPEPKTSPQKVEEVEPSPGLVPEIWPTPEPTPAPKPKPSPKPSPVPTPKPTITAKPTPAKGEAPAPAPAPQPFPQPKGVSVPKTVAPPVTPTEAIPTPTTKKPPKKIPIAIPLKLKESADDSEKRKYIKKKGGAVTWNMGKLTIKGVERDVWHVRFDDGEHLIVLGSAPKGARIVAEGKGSATKTAQRIGTRGFNPFTQRHGFIKASLTPAPTRKGADIRFSPLSKSQRVGPMFKTKTSGGHTLISRRRLA